MSQSPPTTLGKYQILREIARSNDIVYEAYDPVMNRRVALKELSMPAGATEPQREDRVRRFLREAKAAGSLAHPNVVTIYEYGEDTGRQYIAMEYLDGQNLRNMLDTKGFIEPKRAIEIVIEVLNGLEFAHSHGVIHRDIKPDNIQLLENGEVKITDFGIARLTFEPNLTMDGQVFGTPSYMSPEQINGREIDARSDVFSVGVILYEMVAGQKPFTGDNVVSITYAIMNTEPDQPTQCPPGLWQVIRQAVDKSPQLRWSGAKEMMGALRSVLSQIESGSVVADPMLSPSYAIPAPPPVIPQTTGLTPYGTPMPGSIHLQPYQQVPYGQPYQHTPYAAQGQPPSQLTQFPVYYPPPPRGPIVSAETRYFLGRMAIAFLVIGSIVAAVVMAIVKGAEAVNKSGNLPKATNSKSAPSGGAGTSRSPARPTKSQDAKLAIADAMRQPEASSRRDSWSRASQFWAEAITEDNDSLKVRTDAVNSFLAAANDLVDAGYPDIAREAVYEAQGFAQGYIDLEQRVEAWKVAFGR